MMLASVALSLCRSTNSIGYSKIWQNRRWEQLYRFSHGGGLGLAIDLLPSRRNKKYHLPRFMLLRIVKSGDIEICAGIDQVIQKVG